ncbi:O-antigen ligase family protein [Botrimarina sp.]|uniref:O-antigen ligase family protein n=1 Tax=Botrimarina sp. TaxID=2795802 RepID=UPI0032EB736D
MGHYVIIGLIVAGCVTAVTRPAVGCILFYFIALLDPAWNWRWALPPDPGYQKWIFFSLAAGAALTLGRVRPPSGVGRWAIASLLLFLALAWASWQQSAYHFEGAYYMSVIWKIALVAALSIWLIDDRKHLKMLLIACVVGSAYNAYQINLDYFETGVTRWIMRNWGSSQLDNNTYSLLTLPMMAIAVGGVLGFQKKYLVYGCLAAATLQAHQFMLVESRGAMLAALVLAVLALWFMPKTKRNIRLTATAAVFVAVLAGPPVVKEFSSAFAPTEELDSSAESRFYLWSAGARMIADYPFTGVGPYVSRYYVPIYYEGGLDRKMKALHNLIFEVGAETGIPGLIAYLGYFFIPFWAVYKNRRRYLAAGPTECAATIAVLSGAPAYFVGSMFSAGTLIESCYLLPVVACVLLRLDAEGEIEEPLAIEHEVYEQAPRHAHAPAYGAR